MTDFCEGWGSELDAARDVVEAARSAVHAYHRFGPELSSEEDQDHLDDWINDLAVRIAAYDMAHGVEDG